MCRRERTHGCSSSPVSLSRAGESRSDTLTIPKEGRKHWALRPQKPLRLIRDGEVRGVTNFISNTYSLHCHHQNDSALRWAVVCAILMFHSLCGESQKTVSINHFFLLKRKESRSGSNRGLSAYQPSALPLGHTDSRTTPHICTENIYELFVQDCAQECTLRLSKLAVLMRL